MVNVLNSVVEALSAVRKIAVAMNCTVIIPIATNYNLKIFESKYQRIYKTLYIYTLKMVGK